MQTRRKTQRLKCKEVGLALSLSLTICLSLSLSSDLGVAASWFDFQKTPLSAASAGDSKIPAQSSAAAGLEKRSGHRVSAEKFEEAPGASSLSSSQSRSRQRGFPGRTWVCEADCLLYWRRRWQEKDAKKGATCSRQGFGSSLTGALRSLLFEAAHPLPSFFLRASRLPPL